MANVYHGCGYVYSIQYHIVWCVKFSARLLMKEYGVILKKKLWGGHLWNPSYFVATVSENTEEQIKNYIASQKEK